MRLQGVLNLSPRLRVLVVLGSPVSVVLWLMHLSGQVQVISDRDSSWTLIGKARHLADHQPVSQSPRRMTMMVAGCC